MPRHIDHAGQVVSTDSAEAAAWYADGVSQLIRSPPDAIPALRAALAADPSLGVALVALAVATAERSEDVPVDLLEAAVASSSSATRRERQHIEILAAALSGDAPRARALSYEHLAEFPTDLLVASVMARHCPADRPSESRETPPFGELSPEGVPRRREDV